MNFTSSTAMLHTGKMALLLVLICTSSMLFGQSSVLYPKNYLQAKVVNGKKFSDEELHRLADLGKLWGVLNYFNPKVNTGGVVTDSLALQPVRLLMADLSAEGFRKAVTKMLELVDDGGTRLVESSATVPSLLFIKENTLPEAHTLQDSTIFIAIPTRAAAMVDNPSAIKGFSIDEWRKAKASIFDIRNEGPSGPYTDYDFMYNILPVICQIIAGNTPLPSVFERRVFHSGFVSQSSNTPNIYSSGWQVIAGGNYSFPNGKDPLNKPVAFIYNRYTDIDIIKQLSVLRTAGLCRLIYEGTASSYPNGSAERLILADSVTVQVRVNDFLITGDQPLPAPDLQIDRIADIDLKGKFLQQVTAVLNNNGPSANNKSSSLPPDFVLPRPNRYADTLVPSADKRLFGLYNFWNAFHYFSPYKDGLDHSWDSILYKYVPVFLNANDSLSYMLAVRSLASETQDCHGFVNSILPATPARKFYGAWPPVQMAYVDHKVHIVELAKDSSQDLSQLQPGDEVTHVDGLTIEQIKQQWRSYLPTSNESTYERDFANYLPTGPLNSVIKLTVLKNKKPVTVTLKRNARWNMGTGFLNFNKKHKAVEMLPGNTGYINMGNLRQKDVDSAMKALWNTKAIIFDIRNYPQGTAWAIAPLLTDTPKKAVVFDKPFVNYEYLRGGEDQSTLKSAFTAMPSGRKPYKGKIIMLCNQATQSQAEYTIMMFQGAAPGTVIGSQTAGADGNVTDVTLPGGYSITFSGLGIYYPDGTPTQRRGIRVDIQSKPTIAGLLAGKDEVLERAVKFIETGR